MKAKVAVITRTHNRPLFLRRAIESVLNQSMEDWVHVIVNDGGDAGEVDFLVTEYAEEYRGRCVPIHLPDSVGMQNASNAGIESSESEFIVIHDDDDSWQPRFLEVAAQYLDEKGANHIEQGVVTQTTQVLEEVHVSGELHELSRHEYYPFDCVNLPTLATRNLFPPIAFLFRRRICERVGRFNQEFDVLGDHDFNLRFLMENDIGVVPLFLANYHWRYAGHGNTVTTGVEKHRRMLSKMKNAYMRAEMAGRHTGLCELVSRIEEPPRETPVHYRFQKRYLKPVESFRFADFGGELNEAKVVSIDVFDTALLRKVHLPTDVFKLWEARIVRKYSLSAYPYAAARKSAERKAREKTDTKEITLLEIYDELCRVPGLDQVSKEDLMNEEIAVEKLCLYANPIIKRFCEEAKAAGKQIVFLSDMYLGEGVIRELLEMNGFEVDRLLVSCEYGRTKHTGELFDLLSSELECEPGDVFHLGDNYNSDYVQPRRRGIQSVFFSKKFMPQPFGAEARNQYVYYKEDLFTKVAFGLAGRQSLANLSADASQEEGAEPLWSKIGYQIAGPLFVFYLHWVLKEAARDGVKKLYFVARDGYYLEKVFRMLCRRWNIDIESRYLYSSRRLWNIAAITEMDEVAMKFLTEPNPRLMVRDFLERIGLAVENFGEELRFAGFDDFDRVITSKLGGEFIEPGDRGKLRAFFCQITPVILHMAEGERENLLQYFDDAGFDSADSAIVDVGWQASSVRSLERLWKIRKEPNRARGYYLGTMANARASIEEGGRLSSFLVHLGRPLHRMNLLQESISILEFLFTAPHSTIIGIEREGDDWKPVYEKISGSGLSEGRQEEVWEAARQFTEDFLEIIDRPFESCDGFEYLELALERLLREPTESEVKVLGELKHSDGFGSEVLDPIVISHFDPAIQLTKAYDLYLSSSWKKGFLTLLPEGLGEELVRDFLDHNPKDVGQLKEDLRWQREQTDKYWGESQERAAVIRRLQKTIRSPARLLKYWVSRKDKFTEK